MKYLCKPFPILLGLIAIFISSCGNEKSIASTELDVVRIDVDSSFFLTDGTKFTISLVDCELSDGSPSNCYKIVTNGTPTDHAMGPWCPTHISDNDSMGGIWMEHGHVHDVDGNFVQNMAMRQPFHITTTRRRGRTK